jgi:hypothetical protein
MAESLKQLRTLLTTLLTVSLLWLVTAHSVSDALVRRAHAKELLAWLTIRDALIAATDQLADENTQVVKCLIRIVSEQSGTEVRECAPIVATLPLVDHATATLELDPVPGLNGIYRVLSSISTIPLTSYTVAVIHSQLWILPSELRLGTAREFHHATLRDGLASPRHWPAMRSELHSQGWSGLEPKDLKANDSVVSKFLRQAFTATFTLASIPIAAPIYPRRYPSLLPDWPASAGPHRKLSRSVGTLAEEPWIMLAKEPGRLGSLLTGLQLLLALALILLPIGIYATQVRLWSKLEFVERVIWLIPGTLVLSVSLILVLITRRLMQLRS